MANLRRLASQLGISDQFFDFAQSIRPIAEAIAGQRSAEPLATELFERSAPGLAAAAGSALARSCPIRLIGIVAAAQAARLRRSLARLPTPRLILAGLALATWALLRLLTG